VPMYQDAPAAYFVFVLNDAEIAYAVVEDQEQVDKMQESMPQVPTLKHIFYDDPRGLRNYEGVLAVDRLQDQGREFDRAHPGFYDGEIAKGGPDDVSVMLYTSGTTGKPKGVCQTHGAFIASAKGGAEFDRLTPDDSILSYLPMAWVGDHLFSLAQWVYVGFTINCPESGDTVMTDLREIGPTYYFAPPRVFENLLTQVTIRMEDASFLKRWMYAQAMAVARRCGAEILDGKPVRLGDRLQYALGNLFVYGLGLLARVRPCRQQFTAQAVQLRVVPVLPQSRGVVQRLRHRLTQPERQRGWRRGVERRRVHRPLDTNPAPELELRHPERRLTAQQIHSRSYRFEHHRQRIRLHRRAGTDPRTGHRKLILGPRGTFPRHPGELRIRQHAVVRRFREQRRDVTLLRLGRRGGLEFGSGPRQVSELAGAEDLVARPESEGGRRARLIECADVEERLRVLGVVERGAD